MMIVVKVESANLDTSRLLEPREASEDADRVGVSEVGQHGLDRMAVEA